MIVIVDDLTEEEIIQSIESALIEELNIHRSDVKILFDPETGEVIYTITSDDAESIADVINDLQTGEFEETLSSIDGIIIDSIDVQPDIVVTVDVVVDASNADDVDSVVDLVTSGLQQQDPNYDISGSGSFYS